MAATPMMQQYEEAKRACPDALLLFRMGDFYELFHDDAKTAARVLNLALTSREKGAGAIPMAGFPHHQLEGYLGKLIAAGHRAAVCEQVEDPKQAKGLVRREVTRVVTPGTVTDEALLDPREANYLAAVAPPPAGRDEPLGLAWVELSTGRFTATGCAAGELADHLARLQPAECLIAEDGAPGAVTSKQATAGSDANPAHGRLPAAGSETMLTQRPAWAFGQDEAHAALEKHFGTRTLEGFGFTDTQADQQAIRAAGAVLDYLTETQRTGLEHVDRLVPYARRDTMEIDQSSRRSLELTRTIRDGRREGSLLGVLDRTVTAMGSRMLAEWLANPLSRREPIVRRHEAVEELLGDPALCDALRDALKQVYDLERLLGRVATGRASPRDLAFIGRSLRLLPTVKAKLTARRSPLLSELEEGIDLCGELSERLVAALVDDCPLSARDGGFIRPGFHPPLDELNDLARGGKQWIAGYQAQESKRSGIPNLKIGFNKVFGYYIEVTHAHRDKIPDDYIRKQTLKNAERYITPELKEYEEKVLSADEKAKEIEYELFVALRNQVAAERRRMQRTADVLARLDVLLGLADLARANNYSRPEMTDEPVMELVDGRHPVVEQIEPEGTFVPNDAHLGGDAGTLLLITGPNMAGKSTYIRQVALIALMAQIGSFVPARKATLGVADRIFARVGASDELTRGQGTFMVEMTETARILNTATRHSLVILDEIGRGTSTYDGISLAWSVAEHLHDRIGCRTLFATHYHELTDLRQELTGLRNFNVAVREWQEEVVFLHKIVEGTADKSYGIHVARLAGVPREVVERAKDILGQLEAEHHDASGRSRIAQGEKKRAGQMQLTLFAPLDHPLLDELRALDLDDVSPREALRRLEQWQSDLKREAGEG